MTLKEIIKSSPALHRVTKQMRDGLKRLWRPPLYKETSRSPSSWVEHIIRDAEAQVVQIGSNDGNTGDPLFRILQRQQSWRGLFVEPVPYLFERLKKNYADAGRFSFENACINDGEQATFYWVDPRAKQFLPSLPEWYDQLGSFNRAHITNLLPEVDPFIMESAVEGLSLRSLLERHGIAKIDVLHIDAEGYDWQILRQLDLKAFRPGIILYEAKHLAPGEGRRAARFLRPRYNLYTTQGDVVAVRKDADRDFKLEKSEKRKS
jgi:FkbM family methyltransferase